MRKKEVYTLMGNMEERHNMGVFVINHHHKCDFLLLSNELLLEVASFLTPTYLLRLECVCNHLMLLDTNEVWNRLCQQRWRNWPLYRMLESEFVSGKTAIGSWKAKYRHVEAEVTRTKITKEELESFEWFFNFSSQAGGRGRATLRRCRFMNDYVYLRGFPPLSYRLGPSINESHGHYSNEIQAQGREGEYLVYELCDPEQVATTLDARPFCRQQCLYISDFPPHLITRVISTGEWLILNDSVTFVSCHGTSFPTYSKRMFI